MGILSQYSWAWLDRTGHPSDQSTPSYPHSREAQTMAAHSISSLSSAAAAVAAAGGGRSTLSLSRRPLYLGSSILPFSLSPSLLLRPRPRPTVVSMLPSSNAERAATAKWSSRAIKSFGMGELEARKLKYPNTGTEALLMGMLVEGTSQAAQFLRANGITLFKVREETVKLLGKSDMYFFSPEHPPLTEPAQKALDWAVDEKLKSGDSGEITTAHMLLGIWAQEDSAGHKILASLGFDNDKANELAKTASKDIIMNYR